MAQSVFNPQNYEMEFTKYFGMSGLNVSWGFDKTYEEARIMVNDYNVKNNSDFDFNDLVFDAKFTNSGAKITLRAVGTISPIRIGGKEAHEVFGVSTNTLVNTKDISYDAVTFDLEGNFGGNYNTIEVEMQDENGYWHLLQSRRGDATTKLAVPTSVKWCMENEIINIVYPDFSNYLHGNDCNWWENYQGSNEKNNSGACGENLTWKYDETTKTLTISGTGEMDSFYFYEEKYSPWYELRNSIQKVVLEPGVTSIGAYAFSGCAMTSVIIPPSLTIIKGQAFESCHNLKSVNISDLSAWCNVVLEGGTDEGDFKRTDFIESNPLVFAEHLYLNGDEVKELVIPDNTTSINKYTFIRCPITSLTIPESVNNIGVGAFWYCTKLSNVYCFAENVPQIDSHAFVLSSIDKATLHVPANSVDEYKSTSPWNKFKEILPIKESGNDDPMFASQIVGKWELLWATPYSSYGMTHIEFKADGSFRYTSIEDPNCEEHGVYKIEDGILYQMFSNEDDWELSRIKYVDSNYLKLIKLTDDGLEEIDELYFLKDNVSDYWLEIAGTWLGAFPYKLGYKTINRYKQWIFNPDGTGSLTERIDDNNITTEDSFRYKVTESTITIDWGDGSPDIYDYMISGVTLTLTRYDKTWNYYWQGETTSIRSIVSENVIEDIYSLSGTKLKSPSKGINIIKLKDGTTKKVLVK